MGKKLDGEWVFLNLENGVYYGLNETGSLIWDELTESKDPQRATDRLAATFDIERTLLNKDVKNLLRELKKEGLIKIETLPA